MDLFEIKPGGNAETLPAQRGDTRRLSIYPEGGYPQTLYIPPIYKVRKVR
jgi:hypothetical protein